MSIRDAKHCQRNLDTSISSTLTFLAEARTLKVLTPGGVYREISGRRSELFAGLALIKLRLAWEEFLESVFLRYMCGAQSSSGFSPILLRLKERSISSAMTTLLGTQNYLNWSPNNTRTRALRHFDQGEPFVRAIGTGGAVLEEMFIVRNRFAHRSDFAAH